MNTKKVIIFGASGYGKYALYSLEEDLFDVIAFIDNNSDCQGSCFNGILIDSPRNIGQYIYDYVVISEALYSNEMNEQLLELGVNPDKIITFHENHQDLKWKDLRMGMMKLCIDEIREKNIEGSIAEVGVYRGEFAKYLNCYLPDKTLYLFDTFEGFNTKDSCADDLKLDNNGEFLDTSVEIVMSKMVNPERCIIKKGYFPESANGLEDTFCFVSLDADLYKPILSGLEYFYPRLRGGGYIFVHDYGTYAWNGVKKAVRLYCERNHISYIPLLDKCGSIIITK